MCGSNFLLWILYCLKMAGVVYEGDSQPPESTFTHHILKNVIYTSVLILKSMAAMFFPEKQ